MEFGGLQKVSLIDFPDRIATVLFTSGCNLRCPFCHNWRLVLGRQNASLPEETVFRILESRKKFVDAVVITGGEPLIHSGIPQFLKKLKEREFVIKLDTNGFFPDMLERSLPYLDYVAMDVKTSAEKYVLLGANDISNYSRAIEILKQGSVNYEFRTTVVPGFVNKEDIAKMGALIKGAKRFAFQQFVPGDTLDRTFNAVKPYAPEVIAHFANVMKKYVDEMILRV
jgi:pyruvate formate lyase activating enzyme